MVAHPTMSGRVKSVTGKRLVLLQNDGKERVFHLSQSADPALLRPGVQISVEVIGSFEEPMKGGKVVPWSDSASIVPTRAKAPGYVQRGDFPSSAGVDGMPEGAPTNPSSLTNILGETGNGGSAGMPQPPSTLPSP